MEIIFQYSSNYFFAYIYILKIAFMHLFPKAKCQNIENKSLLVNCMPEITAIVSLEENTPTIFLNLRI